MMHGQKIIDLYSFPRCLCSFVCLLTSCL